MKKTTMQSLVAYLNGETVTNLDEIKAELEAELSRNADKAAANRKVYDEARELVLAELGMTDKGVTLAELYESCEDKLPNGFTKGKLQYALLHYWNDAVNVTQDKGGNTYRLR